MEPIRTIHDKVEAEEKCAWNDRAKPVTVYDMLRSAAEEFGDRPAISFQLLSDPNCKAETSTWKEVFKASVQTANLFRSLGVGSDDAVAYLLPNSLDTAIALFGGMIAGRAAPINPLLDVNAIAALLRKTDAKVVVTLKSFPKTDIAQKAAAAVDMAGGVRHILEIDLNRNLAPPKSWLVPFIRPANRTRHGAKMRQFRNAISTMKSDRLTFDPPNGDSIAANFHTGGTTGLPKIAQHRHDGVIYNGWCGKVAVLRRDDVLMCPLPLFHVFAVYPILMSCATMGAHVIFPTPAGYRGEGVFDNFWKLVERWRATFLVLVPTAAAALMQRPVNADLSTLEKALCGSSPLPLELFRRFEKATGVKIIEGYGLTEATCLVSVNPLDGERKVGSVGLPFPYTDVRILECDEAGQILKECETGEVGEICVSNPGVWTGETYIDSEKNEGLFAGGTHLRTGDLGRLDEDGYLWITGRAKDLIIRSGNNVDPAIIEESLAGHPAVAFVGAVGQPDPMAGELPAAYVELVADADVTADALIQHANETISNRLAVPVHVEILSTLPKTAVGKVFKPDLRRLAIHRVFDERFKTDTIDARVADVADDAKHGLVANIEVGTGCDRDQLAGILGEYSVAWSFVDRQ